MLDRFAFIVPFIPRTREGIKYGLFLHRGPASVDNAIPFHSRNSQQVLHRPAALTSRLPRGLNPMNVAADLRTEGDAQLRLVFAGVHPVRTEGLILPIVDAL